MKTIIRIQVASKRLIMKSIKLMHQVYNHHLQMKRVILPNLHLIAIKQKGGSNDIRIDFKRKIQRV